MHIRYEVIQIQVQTGREPVADTLQTHSLSAEGRPTPPPLALLIICVYELLVTRLRTTTAFLLPLLHFEHGTLSLFNYHI